MKITTRVLLLSLLFIPFFSACKKSKKGVLEVRYTIKGTKVEHYYWAMPVEEGVYEAGKEFVLYEDPLYKKVGYYWPDESAKSLGYKHKCDVDEDLTFKVLDECDGSEPGQYGNWASASTASCPVGTWYSTDCGGDPQGVSWTFDGKRGKLTKKDCNGICTPMVFTFSYTAEGNTYHLVYDQQQPVIQCTGYGDSRPPAPSNTSITVVCNSDNTITVTSGSGSTVFKK